MRTFLRTISLFSIALTSFFAAGAQEEPEYIYKPIQLTLFPPLTTNGPAFRQTVNGISINAFWGESEGLRGLELGGIANIEHGFMNGVQMAGVANLVKGDVKGLQFSHFANIAGGDVLGGQFAGFLNISKDVTGVQSSGFMNVARSVRGTQMGFINIAEDYESGVPLGFINIIKNGYHAFEISGSEIWDLNFGYRLGINKFYTQFMLGAQQDRRDGFLGIGFGIGTRFSITRYFSGSADLLSYQIIDGGRPHHQWPNLLEQARFTLEGRILKSLRWFIGPTFNLLVIPYEYPEPGFLARFDSWTIYGNASGFSYVRMWPGIAGGIRF
jgi:hypothetical protein